MRFLCLGLDAGGRFSRRGVHIQAPGPRQVRDCTNAFAFLLSEVRTRAGRSRLAAIRAALSVSNPHAQREPIVQLAAAAGETGGSPCPQYVQWQGGRKCARPSAARGSGATDAQLPQRLGFRNRCADIFANPAHPKNRQSRREHADRAPSFCQGEGRDGGRRKPE